MGGDLYKNFLIFLAFFTLVLFFVEGFLLYTYNTLLTPYVIDSIMQSNFKESKEFLETFLGVRIVLVVLCLFAATFLYFKFFDFSFSFRFHNAFLGFFVLVSVIFFADMAVRYHKGKDAFEKFKQFSLTRAIYSVAEFYGNHNFFYDYKKLVTNYQSIRNSYEGAINVSADSPTHIVLVLGESTQRNFMSLYGFSLPTTPYLDSLQNSGNLVAFSDTIANFAQTKLALQNLLNFSNAGDETWYHYLDIVNLFSLAGYKTAIFSNQEIVGSEVQAISSISAYADYKSSANRLLTSSRIAESQIGYDGILLPWMKEFYAQNKESKTFNIVHLMGTHNTYSKRYPREFAKFSKEDLSYANSLNSSQKDIVATYLNALLYNDFILNAIYEIYKNEDAIIFYVSDHGESLYQHQGKLGHFSTTRFNAEIPLVALMSESFKQKHPKTLKSLQSSKDKPFMLDDLIHTLTNIAQIEVKDYDSTKDILSDDFNTQRVRMFNLKADYDKDLKQEKDSSLKERSK